MSSETDTSRFDDGEFAPAAPAALATPATLVQRAPSRLRTKLGLTAFVLALVAVLIEVWAMAVGNAQYYFGATVLAWLVIALSAFTFLTALIALVLKRNRGFAVAAMIVSVLANPLVLVAVFEFVGP